MTSPGVGRDPARLAPAELLRAADIARWYFLEGRSKSDIAGELGISRFKVARILDEARERGIVRIEIRLPGGLDADLAEDLRGAFGLRHAIVVDVPDVPVVPMRESLARAAAALLGEVVTAADVLGVGYGRTLTVMADCVEHLAPCPVVQLTGALIGVNPGENSVELVRKIADRSGGPCYQMFVPQVLPDARTAALLRQQPEVAEAYRHFGSVTVAVVAVGSWRPPHSQLYEALSVPERDRLLEQQVVAEVGAVLLDEHGRQVGAEFTERCISIDGDQLREVAEVIAVAGGAGKAGAIRAVLRGGYANSLIVNTSLATALLTGMEGD